MNADLGVTNLEMVICRVHNDLISVRILCAPNLLRKRTIKIANEREFVAIKQKTFSRKFSSHQEIIRLFVVNFAKIQLDGRIWRLRV